MLAAAVLSCVAAVVLRPPQPAGQVTPMAPVTAHRAARRAARRVWRRSTSLSTKGHEQDRVLFSKWNSFSRVAVYDRAHGDWSLSPTYTGKVADSLFMDIDSAASTPILKDATSLDATRYLRSELTALAYHLAERTGGFTALVIGPGGGRDLAAALTFGAGHVDGVEINPIIARDVMLGRFRDYSGNIYGDPRVSTSRRRRSQLRPPQPSSSTTSSRRRSSTPGRPRRPAPTRSPRTRCTRPRPSAITSITSATTAS